MLKIAYCGYDDFSICLKTLLSSPDARVIKIFTNDRSAEVQGLAKEHGIPFSATPVTAAALDRLFDKEGCDYVFSACYGTKIPIGGRRGVNVHPAPLPVGRGPWPISQLILEGYKESALTLHKLTDRFDAGDIVLQRRFPIAEDETLDTLFIKSMLPAEEMTLAWLADHERLWQQAAPQGEGSYFPRPSSQMQTVSPEDTAEVTDRRIRAFGSHGVFYEASGKALLCYAACCKKAEHGYEPGTVLLLQGRNLCAAVKDGLFYARHAVPRKKAGLARRIARRLKNLFAR
ncbi:MAG: hypothetical protein ILO36_02345 [Abditibacteriota bacterium]|nr:hypothetical protein [Abditibacteriota bacterium]